MNKITLKVTYSGLYEADSSWGGTVISPTDSRLYFILDGSFYIISPRGEKTVLDKGNAYLIPSGYSFDYRCDGKMSHVFFHVILSSFDGLDILKNVEKPISCPFAELPEGILNFSTIVDSLNTESFITSMLHYLLSSNGVSLELNRYSKEVKSAIEYIRRNLSIQLDIVTVAENAFSAPSTLTRNFRRETGMSIGEYVDSLIYREAEKLLKSTNMTAAEISDRLGFCDQFYFSRKFREKYGVSPVRYRKLNVDI